MSSQATCHVSHNEIANIANMFLHRLVDTCIGYLMTNSTNIVTMSFMILLCRIVHVTSLNFKQHIQILAESESVRLVLVSCTPAIQGHRVEGSKNLRSSKSYIFHPFQALYCRARCADYKKVSYVGVGPSKVGQKRAKLLLASAS